jgi:hypothetical protein
VLIENHEDLVDEMTEVKERHGKVWRRVQEQLDYARCMIGFAQRIQ